MKLKDLKQKGGFIDLAPVEKDITWTNPDGEVLTFSILVKRQSFGSMERVLREDPKDPERSRNASMVAESVLLGDNGDEKISYEEAFSLAPSLALEFVKAINEVNGKADGAPKA